MVLDDLQDAAAGLTVDGAAEFTQNFLSGTNSRYTIWIRGPNMEGGNFAVGFADDCTGANYVVSCAICQNQFIVIEKYIFAVTSIHIQAMICLPHTACAPAERSPLFSLV